MRFLKALIYSPAVCYDFLHIVLHVHEVIFEPQEARFAVRISQNTAGQYANTCSLQVSICKNCGNHVLQYTPKFDKNVEK